MTGDHPTNLSGKTIHYTLPMLLRTSLPDLSEDLTSRALDALTPAAAVASLKGLGLAARLVPRLRGQLAGMHPLGVPWSFDAAILFTTRDGRFTAHARFARGTMTAGFGPVDAPDITVRFEGLEQVRTFFSPSGDALNMLLSNEMAVLGNLTKLARFGFLTSCFRLKGKRLAPPPEREPSRWQDLRARRAGEPARERPEGEVRFLDDPSLARATLDDLPRVKRLLWVHRNVPPEICTERPRLLTEFLVREKLAGAGVGQTPVLRQARALAYLLTRKRAIIHDDDLLAGTTTARRIGVVIYPETHGTTIWPELLTVASRRLNPYRISDEDVQVLSQEVFPFWTDDNIREYTRRKYDTPLSMALDERFVLYFQWKTAAISHTIVDYPRALTRGLRDIRREAGERRELAEREAGSDSEAAQFYRAFELVCEGVMDYAHRLAVTAREQAAGLRGDSPAVGARRRELEEMARVCDRVPAEPARTLHEAIQAVWVLFLCQHQENMNAGLSLGRLDLWLQPYLEHDMEGVDDAGERERRVGRALELVCGFMLKLTDHLPLVPDVGNRLFGGSSSDQVITLGGVRPDGGSAVCDMTWIFLKATEMLGLRDPNMNARHCPGVTSDAYLRRLCEVNLLTRATPSIHNDLAMVPALTELGFPLEAARDWGATGCVEPTICGRHYGHTGCIMFNLVAPLEMALNDGLHPVLGDRIGPRTGDPRSFETYDQIWTAFTAQLGWLLDRAVEANNMLGTVHREIKPTPLLSALFTGPMDSGRDVVDGGAVYNSTGMAMVGLADVVDSLVAIRTLVFEWRRLSMSELLEALAADFVGHEQALAEVLHRVPKFGQDDEVSLDVARAIQDFIYQHVTRQENYRGGRYVPGYWSMSNHVAFGLLSGALPSGRRRGKPFSPGLTPTPLCGAPLTEQMRTVASLDARRMPNNMAFNVKLVPGASDSHSDVVDRMAAYTRAYFEMGGMQLQFNVVSSETLRRAMEHPADYRDLLVRISGYNAYFVDLNRDMQLELIERTEHALGGR